MYFLKENFSSKFDIDYGVFLIFLIVTTLFILTIIKSI